MAITKISSDKSRLTTAAGTPAFGLDVGDDTALADGLTVDVGAFLVATGVGSPGAFLQETGAWTVLVNGSIVSQQSTGILLLSGNPASSSITIGVDGEVSGAKGIEADSPVTIKNSGIVFGATVGVELSGPGKHTITNAAGATISGTDFSILDQSDLSDDIVTNAGTLVGDVDLGGGNDSFTNSKFHETFVEVDLGAGNDTLTNSGFVDFVQLGDGINSATNSGRLGNIEGGKDNDTVKSTNEINGSVLLGDGINSLTNSGTIHGAVSGIFDSGKTTGGSGSDTITNSGSIRNIVLPGAAVELGEGTNKLTNSGFIGGHDGGGSVSAGAGTDTVVNTGKIEFNVDLGEGSNTVTNSGSKAVINDVLTGSGNDTVTNSGTIRALGLGEGDNKVTNSGTITNGVFLGDGDDVVINTGSISSTFLAGGDDTFTGGAKNEGVNGGGGDDVIKLGAGNDSYGAGVLGGPDGTDIIDGGTGVDSTSVGSNAATINIDTVDHDLAVFGFGAIATKNTLTGLSVGTDKVTGFENVFGGDGSDTIYGSAVANALDGGDGGDLLVGFAGNDILTGRQGADHLSGGAGKDTLNGAFPFVGGDDAADRFLYAAITESGTTKATRDLITDFEDDLDEIWLTPIDANTKNGTLNDPADAFNFIGTNKVFGGNPGELRAYWTANGQIVEGDVNGDKKADFSIEIFDPTHAITLTAADFEL